MTPQMKAALVRGLIGGSIAAVLALVAWAATQPQYAVAAGIAGAFVTRFLVEGGFDSYRNANGQVSSADVGANK